MALLTPERGRFCTPELDFFGDITKDLSWLQYRQHHHIYQVGCLPDGLVCVHSTCHKVVVCNVVQLDKPAGRIKSVAVWRMLKGFLSVGEDG